MLTLKAIHKSLGNFCIDLEDNNIVQLVDEFCRCLLGNTIVIRLKQITYKCRVISIAAIKEPFIIIIVYIIKKYTLLK